MNKHIRVECDELFVAKSVYDLILRIFSIISVWKASKLIFNQFICINDVHLLFVTKWLTVTFIAFAININWNQWHEHRIEPKQKHNPKWKTFKCESQFSKWVKEEEKKKQQTIRMSNNSS